MSSMKDKSISSGLIPVEMLTGGGKASPQYWRSVEECCSGKQTVPEEAEQFSEEGVEISEGSRRRFVSLMAGSLALAGVTGCTRQPVETIMPYVKAPENTIPGIPKYYATALPVQGIAQGVIVETHLGRPTKVEGNPDHPASLGASSVPAQASVMDLYDPDRAKAVSRLGLPESWDQFLIAWEKTLNAAKLRNGNGFRILTETLVSPSLGQQIASVLKAFPLAKWHQWEPAGHNSARLGSEMAFGKPVNTYYQLRSANVVVSLDADFLAFGPSYTRYARDFALRRREGDRLDMNRLYVVESTMTSTGGKADNRLALKYSEVQNFAAYLAAAVGVPGVSSLASSSYSSWIAAIASDLKANKGSSVVIPGEHQSPAVHALAHAINSVLENTGKTVIHTDPLEANPVDQLASLRQLTDDMNRGAVETLLIIGGNPVYNSPFDLPFTSGLDKVKMSVHTGLHYNETSLKTTWQVPESHYFEDWGDTRSFDGTASILQPLIQPLFDSHSALTILDAAVQFPGRSAYDIVRQYWSQHPPSASKTQDFEQWWRVSVGRGLIAGSAFPPVQISLQALAIAPLPPEQGSKLELVFRPDTYLYDGCYANNMWLQELPRPMTKLTWDNAVLMSPATAKKRSFANQQHVELRYGGKSVTGSVWILPGQPNDSVTVNLGFGRWQAGRAGNGAGFNAYALRSSNNLWSATGLDLRKLDTPYPLASTQMHWSMQGRDLVISNTVEEFRRNPEFVQKTIDAPKKNESLYPSWDYNGYKWGMSIDQTACVNCGTCIVACQAENNIPVVGKEQVLASREMHWLRIDTYYQGDIEKPSAHYQPLPCMQCEDAPCELVCPVQATVHSSEGINDMVYNRCVGTRYCSNNCPYKVRRFNFLLYQDWKTETLKLQRNPDVSIRSRGVMEKCTYCVQRIREADITARRENRYIREADLKTACQQACPTQAIIFGDLNDSSTRVAQLQKDKLSYALLAELNTRPRTTYLAELRNPNSKLKEDVSS